MSTTPAARFSFLLLSLFIVALFFAGCGSDTAAPAAPAGDAGSPAAGETARETFAVGPQPAEITIQTDPAAGEITLSWPTLNPGDYNVDGTVNGMDVFPLAANFNRAADEEPGLECVDGNGDNTLNGMDLFLVSANFQKLITAYYIYHAADEAGPFPAPPLNNDGTAYAGCGEVVEYTFDWEDEGPWYVVKAFETIDETFSEATSPVRAPNPLDEIWPSSTGLTPTVIVDWDNLGDPTDTWNVYRSADSGGPYSMLNTEPVTTSSYTDTAVGQGETWHYVVTTVSQVGIESMYCGEAGVTTPGWEHIVFASEGTVGRYSDIAIDWDDNIWMCWDDESAGLFMVAFFDGTDWSQYSIDDENWPGKYCSMTLDSSQHPGISYRGNGQTKCALFDGADWSTYEVGAGAGYGSSIRFDSDDNPCICHPRSSNGYYFSRFDGSDWTNDDFDTEYASSAVSFVFGWDGNPIIAYQGDSVLKVTRFNGADWITELVDEQDSPGSGVCIELEPGGNPWISYSANSVDEQRLAVWNGSSWDISVIWTNTAGTETDLAFDPWENPVITCRNNPGLRVLWNKDEGWESQYFSVPSNSGINNRLALDSKGHPIVTHYDWTDNDLLLAWYH